jgi:hypothetical protein
MTRVSARGSLVNIPKEHNDVITKSNHLRDWSKIYNNNNNNAWINGDEDSKTVKTTTTTSSSSIGNSGLVSLPQPSASKLASAFLGLQERDQYDAVLTGLCAKILDEVPVEKTVSALQDPMALLQEMNDRQVPASPRSLMALIDVRVACFVFCCCCVFVMIIVFRVVVE